MDLPTCSLLKFLNYLFLYLINVIHEIEDVRITSVCQNLKIIDDLVATVSSTDSRAFIIFYPIHDPILSRHLNFATITRLHVCRCKFSFQVLNKDMSSVYQILKRMCRMKNLPCLVLSQTTTFRDLCLFAKDMVVSAESGGAVYAAIFKKSFMSAIVSPCLGFSARIIKYVATKPFCIFVNDVSPQPQGLRLLDPAARPVSNHTIVDDVCNCSNIPGCPHQMAFSFIFPEHFKTQCFLPFAAFTSIIPDDYWTASFPSILLPLGCSGGSNSKKIFNVQKGACCMPKEEPSFNYIKIDTFIHEDSNLLVIYKTLETESSSVIVDQSTDTFEFLALGMQTKEQREIMLQGSKQICFLDPMPEANGQGYLLNLAVEDKFDQQSIIAHFILVKIDSTIHEAFLLSVRNKTLRLIMNHVMIESSEVPNSSAVEIFHPNTRHLLCIWRLDRNLQNMVSYVPLIEIYNLAIVFADTYPSFSRSIFFFMIQFMNSAPFNIFLPWQMPFTPDVMYVGYDNVNTNILTVNGIRMSFLQLKSIDPYLPYSELCLLRTHGNRGFRIGWLWDTIIDGFISEIVDQVSFLAVPYPVTLLDQKNRIKDIEYFQANNLKDANILFIPDNVLGHWVVIVARLRDRRLEFLDPSCNNVRLEQNRHYAEIIRRWNEKLCSILNVGDFHVTQPRHVTQTDSFNCGIFVCRYVQSIVNNTSLTTKFDTNAFRRHVYAVVSGNCLTNGLYAESRLNNRCNRCHQDHN